MHHCDECLCYLGTAEESAGYSRIRLSFWCLRRYTFGLRGSTTTSNVEANRTRHVDEVDASKVDAICDIERSCYDCSHADEWLSRHEGLDCQNPESGFDQIAFDLPLGRKGRSGVLTCQHDMEVCGCNGTRSHH